jgi:hypothetical protein
VNDVVGGG